MSRVRQDIEAMADLLLGPAADNRPDYVIALIDGNLPSRGDGWRAAAADLLAADSPTTFLQSRFGELDLLSLHTPSPDGDDLKSILERVPGGHRWVISTGSSIDGRMLTGVDEIALLTGVDEAAVVAGYGLLKRLLLERPGPTPAVSLILAGTDVLSSGDRFVQTARAKLGVEPIVRGCLPHPGGSSHAWHRVSLPEGGMCTVLATLVAAAPSRSTATGMLPLRTPDSGPEGAPEPDAVCPQTSAVAFAPPPPQAMGSTAQAPPSTAEYAAEPAPVDAHVPPSVALQDVPVGVPLPSGLTMLGVTCPDAPRVAFATDASGELHAVATAALLADLVAALSWSNRHSAMLPGQGVVQGHVLVGDVTSAAAMQGAPWPVHLVITGPQGPQVLPASNQPLSGGPSSGSVPGWPSPGTH